MDTRQVGHAIRRRVGAPSAVYAEGHRISQDAPASEPPATGHSTLPGTVRGGSQEQQAPHAFVHRSIPMGTDYQAIEDAFDNRNAMRIVSNRDAHDGGMD